MDFEELFKLDELELALRVLRSDVLPRVLFPAARAASERYNVLDEPGAVYRLNTTEYFSLRRIVIQSFRMTFIRNRLLNLHQLICIEIEYCRHRHMAIVDIAVQIAQRTSDAMNLPGEIAMLISVLLIKIQSLDLFCACDA